jgi:glycosyltransferase involved in cell wall biosynthesis
VTVRRMALAVQGRTPERARDPAGTAAPRSYLFDDLFATRYDESMLDSVGGLAISRALPPWARLAITVRRLCDDYDVIVTWSDRVSLSLMTLDRLLGSKKPHIAMMYWFSRPSIRMPMHAFCNSLRAIVTWSSVQRAYAIEHLGIPPEKIYLVRHFVDQLFWQSRTREIETDQICSAGSEMRDYPTLIEALRGTGIPCHIASDHVRIDRFGFARRVGIEAYSPIASGNITVGRKTATELRDLYARSRFVVVPLQPSDTDNGITVILEAMAMGKAVICSRTRGQVDVIRDGITGLLVPVGDPMALRDAILALWRDPARASEMGRAARAHVEKWHTLDKFCRDVKSAVDASLDGRLAAADGSISAFSPARS